MLDAEIADTSSLDLPIIDGIFDCSPALQPLSLASVWTVQQKEINVSQSALSHRLLDGSTSYIIASIARKLGGEMDILALEAGDIALSGKKGLNGGADLFLIVVHLRRINTESVSSSGF